jgi:predicted aspartyl protease
MLRVPLVVEPDEEEPACAAVLIDASVNGVTRRFVLDTGAPMSQLRRDELTAGFNVIGSDQSSGVFGHQLVDLVVVSELTIGESSHRDLAVRRARDPEFSGEDLLGLDVLAIHATRINIEEGWLELGSAASFPTTSSLERGARGHCLVAVTGEGFSARACIDTGAGISLVDPEFFAAHPALFTSHGSSTGSDTSGTQVQTSTYVMSSVAIGSVDFAPNVVAVADLSMSSDRLDMVLGYPTLRQAEWTLDLPRNRISIARPEKPGG